MADIFLSYAKADRARVKPLAEAFERQGYTVWWDRHVPPGSTWAQLIEDELERAGCVVVVWSKASVLSEWVDIEAARAKRRGVLVPVMIDDVADDIPLEFSRLHAARLVDWERRRDDSDFELLMSVIEKALGRSSSRGADERKSESEPSAPDSAGRGEAAEGDGEARSVADALWSHFSASARGRRKRLLVGGAAAVALLVAVSAAGYYASLPTNQEVVDKYTARVDARRSQLRTIAGGLPPKGSVQANTCGPALNPLPFHDAERKLYNTDFMMDWELTRERWDDPNVTGVDLYLAQALEYAIAWRLGSLNESSLRAKDWGGEFAQKFEKALAVRYLIVNRVFDDPQAAEKVRLETFITDLDSAKQICSFPLTVERGKPGDSSSPLQRELRGKLIEATGGVFEF